MNDYAAHPNIIILLRYGAHMRVFLIKPLLMAGFIVLLTQMSGCVSLMSDKLLVSETKPESAFIIRGAKVFDGFQFVTGQDVFVENNKIKALGRDLDAFGVQVIEAAGKTVMPGLIDMHVHLLSSGSAPWRPTMGNLERTLTANLALGVTSVLDMGAPLMELEGWVNDTGLELPRFAYAGTMFNVEHGHPSYMIEKSVFWPLSELFKALLITEVSSIDDIAVALDEHIEGGSSYIKIALDEIPLNSPMLDSKILSQLVKAVHQKGLKVVAHIGTESELLKGLDAGVDMFVHGPYRSSFSSQAITRLKQSGVPVVPTAVVFDQLAKFYQGEDEFSDLDISVMDPDILASYQNRPDQFELDGEIMQWFDQVVEHRITKFKTIESMYHAGITLYAGSDSPNVATAGGSALHQELKLWDTHTNLPSAAILSAATGQSGQWLESNLNWKVGQIKVGYDADLILLDGDAESDIAITQKIESVWIKGRQVISNI